jgi:hypothetical protein
MEHSAHYNVIVSGLGPVRLQVTFREAVPGEFENFSRVWLKSSSNTDETRSGSRPKISRAVDIDLVKLNTILGWKFEITATNIIEDSKITESMRQFAESVTLKASHLRYGHRDSGSISVLDCHHRVTQKFILKGSNYIVELSESVPAAIVKDQSLPTTEQPPERLEMSMYQSHWDSVLEGQKSLPIGLAGDWNPSFSSFFPSENRTGSDMNGLEWTALKARAILGLLSD